MESLHDILRQLPAHAPAEQPVEAAWKGPEQSGPPLPPIEARQPSDQRERPKQKVAAPLLGLTLAWRMAAGPELASRSRVLGLWQGVLSVAAGDEAAARQLRSVEPELRRAVNQMLAASESGQPAVQRLAIVIP